MFGQIYPWGLNNYNINYCSPQQAILPYSQQIQQCCNITDAMNRWQVSSLQSQVNYINTQISNINKINDNIDETNEDNTNEIKEKECIKDYMYKEFFYESELKAIEDKFHFKFEDYLLFHNISKKDKIYIGAMQIIDKLKDFKLKYISKIDVVEFDFADNSIYITCNNNNNIWDIKIDSNDITDKNKNNVMRMCNIIIKKDIPEYQQFYEKYKNRIVKDNEYEDLSYYEKILKENT